ncbi:MAG: putative DNA-methyltransferase [candidate division NC10 bacterium]|nr:putative DNA-methyltransferase [candidate division NC10 bacterium]
MKAVKEALNNVRYAPVSTPLGQLYVAYRGRTICHAMVAATDDAFERACVKRLGARPMRDARPPGEMANQVVDHLTRRRRFQGGLDLNGLTPFQRLVLEKTREIPYGEVRGCPGRGDGIGQEPDSLLDSVPPCCPDRRTDRALLCGRLNDEVEDIGLRGGRCRGARPTGQAADPVCGERRDQDLLSPDL